AAAGTDRTTAAPGTPVRAAPGPAAPGCRAAKCACCAVKHDRAGRGCQMRSWSDSRYGSIVVGAGMQSTASIAIRHGCKKAAAVMRRALRLEYRFPFSDWSDP